MRANLSADEHGDGEFGDEYKTTSLYFETSNFDVYHRHASYGRSKFRIRRYGLLDFIFLERKFRTDRLLAKRRTTVPVTDLQRLAADEADPTLEGLLVPSAHSHPRPAAEDPDVVSPRRARDTDADTACFA